MIEKCNGGKEGESYTGRDFGGLCWFLQGLHMLVLFVPADLRACLFL